MDPGNFLFNPKFRKYFFEKLGSAYAPELKIGLHSGMMHFDDIMIPYRTKNILAPKKIEKLYFR